MPTKPILLDETGKQMVNALNLIAAGVASNMGDVTSWQSVQQITRQGLAPQVFPAGSQLHVTHESLGDLVFDVLGHDMYPNPHDANGHSMMLLMHDAFNGRQVDNTEALYYCETALQPGTYNFTLLAGWDVDYGGGGTYQFTLAKEVPAGGVLVFPWPWNQQASTTKVSSYKTVSDTVAIETVSVTQGTSGTNLGTADGTGNMNHGHRARYGSNHWGESAARQWLNSSAAANAWWTSQTKFDRPPSYANVDGFLKGLDPEFLAVVGEVNVTTAYNTVFNINGQKSGSYVTKDRFFLASMTEINLGNNNGVAEGKAGALFNGATNADRIKLDHSDHKTARYWWLRSSIPSSASAVRYILPDGSLDTSGANSGGGALAPACVIY